MFFDPEDSEKAIKVAFVAQSQTPYTDMNPGYKIYSIDGGRENATYVRLKIIVLYTNLLQFTIEYFKNSNKFAIFRQIELTVLLVLRAVLNHENWCSFNRIRVTDCTWSRELVLWLGRRQPQHGPKFPVTVYGKGRIWVRNILLSLK